MAWIDGQVVEAHRLDDHPQRGSRDHSIDPPSLVTPRGRLTYSGTRRARSSASPAARRAAARRNRLAPSRARAARPRASASAGARPAEVDRQQLDPGGDLGIGPGRQQPGPTVHRRGPGPRTGRQEQRPRAGRQAVRQAGHQGQPGRHADDRQAQGLGQALGRGEPDAQAGERAGPGPDDDPAEVGRAQARGRQQPVDRGQELLAVALAGRPRPRWPAPPGRSRATTASLVDVSIASSGPRSVAGTPAIMGSPPGSARAAGSVALSRTVRGSSPDAARTRRRGGRRAGPGRAVRPIRRGSPRRPGARRGGRRLSASAASSRRYRSRWKRGSRPSYSAIRT